MSARKWRSPALLFALLLVLALATLGLGYAHWEKLLDISGTVETGNVDAEWTTVGCFDFETDKDVGTTSGWIDPDDPQILHFLIENGYPSYMGDCEVEFTYLGSIPVRVEAIRLIPGAGLTNCEFTQDPLGNFIAYCDQLTVEWVDGLCLQLHEGSKSASSLRAHVEQDAEQSSEYTFGVEVQLMQWNLSTCPP